MKIDASSRSRCIGLLVGGCVAYAALIVPAHAYLDPGSGALLVQGLIATVAGGAIAMRQFVGRVRLRLKGRSRTPVSETPDDRGPLPKENRLPD